MQITHKQMKDKLIIDVSKNKSIKIYIYLRQGGLEQWNYNEQSRYELLPTQWLQELSSPLSDPSRLWIVLVSIWLSSRERSCPSCFSVDCRFSFLASFRNRKSPSASDNQIELGMRKIVQLSWKMTCDFGCEADLIW